MGILDLIKGKNKGVAVVAIANVPDRNGIEFSFAALQQIANSTPGYWMEGNKLMTEVEISDDQQD